MEAVYAKALERLVTSGTDEARAVDNLILHLKKEGRMKLLPGILKELKTLMARKELLAPQIEIAREEDKATALESAKALGIEANRVSINPSLIRGWRGRANGRLVDHSGKRALIELYRKIANA